MKPEGAALTRIARHRVLAAGDSFAVCSRQVRRFFERTSLVGYDSLEIREDRSLAGDDPGFAETLAAAVAENRQIVHSLAGDLEKTGIRTIAELSHLQQGYPSKVLHILTHFLDGFIGVDSFFYNLIDDSHWLPEATSAAMSRNPGKYWLILVDGYSATPDQAALLHP
ncbi:hypothetical protein JWG42_07400 [Desulfoprunum benzoelyticum]|uniref:Uncharacterized protein n=1 Tax=Desulfoprunum benzoelyticum TaxID=1506996 RepID=A0A840UVE6_9BACT|nr:hypothetical protein [Desulfoprunum benzoelyticum]MBB5348806.1 hypothetical protein [Desulfoprunum benzoelyticum]MBM9529969.1 hypothetical protein [Desulfoprunum benzoelyticum]